MDGAHGGVWRPLGVAMMQERLNGVVCGACGEPAALWLGRVVVEVARSVVWRNAWL